MTTSIDGITALERAYDDLARVVSNLGADQLRRPTCCPDWDARGLLNHTLGAAVMFTLTNAGLAVSEDAGDLIAGDPVGALARTAAANLAAWRAPGALDGERVYPWGTFPAGVGLLINVGEVALHSWDLARATGQVPHLDPDVAQLVYDFYRQIPMDDMRAHGVFGPEIRVPTSAPVQARLLGLLSRPAASAVVARGADVERLEFADGSMMRLLTDSRATGGHVSVHHTTLRRNGGAGPHHHTTGIEFFYVLRGTVQLLVGEVLVAASEGDLVVVPPLVTHAFAAAPGCEAELLVAATSGVERFDLFRQFERVIAGAAAGTRVGDQSDYDTYPDTSAVWEHATRAMSTTEASR